MNDPKKTVKELHAQLHQKALDLHTGKAFFNPNSWGHKIRTKWVGLSETTQNRIFRVTVGVSLLGLVAFFSCISLLPEEKSWIHLVSILASLSLLVPFGVITSMIEYGNLFSVTKKHVVQQLNIMLQHSSLSHDTVQLLFDHLDHPHININWWHDVGQILNRINALDGALNTEQLRRRLNGEASVLVVEADDGTPTQDGVSPNVVRTKI